MAIVHTQTPANGVANSSATSVALAFGSNVTAAGAIMGAWRYGATGRTVTLSDTLTNTYVSSEQSQTTADGDTLGIGYALNCAAGATTVTFGISGAAANLRFSTSEFSGVATASAMDKKSSATGTSTTPAAGSVTPTTDGQLFYAMSHCFDINTYTAGTDFTLNTTIPATNHRLATERYIQPTATAHDGNFTITSMLWGAVLVTFKAAGATGIAFDAASNSGEQLAQSSYSWNHICTGSNRYLVVSIGLLSLAQTVSGITYNGVAMIFLGAQSSVSGAARIEQWGLVAPSTGTNSIAVTLTGAVNSGGVAASYTGVHQTFSTEGFNSAQATNVGAADATVNVTTVADNDMVIDGVVSDDTSITVGAGQTSRNNISGTVGSVADSDEGPKTPAGSVTMSWSGIGAAATWAIAAIALRPIAASDAINSNFLLFMGPQPQQ